MPEQLVHTIGSLMDRDCSPSDRRKWDGVRRIVSENKTSDPLRQPVIRSLHEKKGAYHFGISDQNIMQKKLNIL